MSTRRDFLRQTAVIGGGVIASRAAFAIPVRQPAPRALRILLLGGTGTSGPHMVAHALQRGHEVTIFSRGRSEATVEQEMFDHVEHLIGDRRDNLTALEGRQWDAVIDNSGRDPEWTRRSAELLRDSTDVYLYTSSTGVFYPYLTDRPNEDRELLYEEPAETNGEYWYAVMKARSEAEALKVFGQERTIITRPTYMIGPGDGSDRFIHWPIRLARGGEILVPGQTDDPVQWIDSRDVAAFTIHTIEQRTTGTFNLAGPRSRMGMQAFVHGAHAAVSSSVDWVWIDDNEFLLEHGVSYIVPWIMPVGNDWGSARIDNSRAIEAGLTFRPLAATTADTLAWWQSGAIPPERRARIETHPESLFNREAGIIAAWRAKSRH